jgi:hypothetical protein
MTNIPTNHRDEAAVEEPAAVLAVPIQLPSERAEFFYLRAKRLYELGGAYSVIMERVVTTTLKVSCTPCDRSLWN